MVYIVAGMLNWKADEMDTPVKSDLIILLLMKTMLSKRVAIIL